ncbi:MAG TPA: hypothetical protein VG709_02365 [Actinomycetota bacterium]|nr:hypothetical protein [Actinomycetota bacterium]
MRAAGPRKPLLRWLSPGMFGVVLISLALPFASVSCSSGEGDIELLTVRGFHLVTGSGPEVNPAVARAADDEALVAAADIGPQPFAALAALAAGAGLGLGFARPARARLVATVSAAVGTASVAIASLRLEVRLTNALAGQDAAAQGAVAVDRERGFWVALIAFAVAGMTAGVAYAAQRPSIARPWRRSRGP